VGEGTWLAAFVAQELLRAVESAACLLDGGLNPLDLPTRLFPQPLGLLDKLTPPRKSLRRLTQIGCLG